MSGEFLQINTALVAELKAHGLWTAQVREADQAGRGLGAGHRRAAGRTSGELFRTAWELPQRALIDLAAARAPFIDQSPVAEPVPGRADHRQALLDVPARLEERPEDHLLPALPARDPHPAGHRRRRDAAPAPTPRPTGPPQRCEPRRLLPGEPRDLRGLPVTHSARPRHGPDPAADALPALLRPVPRRDQEHLDRRGGRPALRPRRPGPAVAGRAAPGLPAGRVLRHRRHDRRQQPRAQPVPARQLARRAGSTCPGSCSRRPCTSSST